MNQSIMVKHEEKGLKTQLHTNVPKLTGNE